MIKVFTIGFTKKDAKQLFLAYRDPGIWLPPVAKLNEKNIMKILKKFVSDIPWSNNLQILYKVSEADACLYYLWATAQFGWSRNVLPKNV